MQKSSLVSHFSTSYFSHTNFLLSHLNHKRRKGFVGDGRSGVYWTIIFANDASDAEDLICPDGKGSAYVSGKKGGGS
jgi:hypothetical protein